MERGRGEAGGAAYGLWSAYVGAHLLISLPRRLSMVSLLIHRLPAPLAPANRKLGEVG